MFLDLRWAIVLCLVIQFINFFFFYCVVVPYPLVHVTCFLLLIVFTCCLFAPPVFTSPHQFLQTSPDPFILVGLSQFIVGSGPWVFVCIWSYTCNCLPACTGIVSNLFFIKDNWNILLLTASACIWVLPLSSLLPTLTGKHLCTCTVDTQILFTPFYIYLQLLQPGM